MPGDRVPTRAGAAMTTALASRPVPLWPPAGAGGADPVAVDPGSARRPGGPPTFSALEQLIVAAVTGDPRARDALLTEIHPLVLRYCRARLGRRDSATVSAEDVAQEICLGVVHALPSYRLKGLSFRAFVYGIAAHKVADAFRSLGRNRTDPVAELPDRPSLVDGPEQRMLAGELGERMARLLGVLTSRQREVVVLRIAVGLSAEQTAETVGSTPGAVRVTQHRALVRLRRTLGRSDTGEGGRDDQE